MFPLSKKKVVVVALKIVKKTFYKLLLAYEAKLSIAYHSKHFTSQFLETARIHWPNEDIYNTEHPNLIALNAADIYLMILRFKKNLQSEYILLTQRI